MRALFLGDIVGRAGRQAVYENLPGLIETHRFDFVVVNGENAAGGFGINEKIVCELMDAGVDVVTTGNHVWDQKETTNFIDDYACLLRPINYPPGTPGRGCNLFDAKNGARVLVINVMGRVFMATLDDPFAALDEALAACPLGAGADAIIIDVHAEATSEKMAIGHFVDGRASLVVGTHSHVPTADARVLAGGTGYMTDAGMCGDYDSVIGMEKTEPINRFMTQIPAGRFLPAQGPVTLCGLAVGIDDKTGFVQNIGAVRLGGVLDETLPDFL